MSQEKRSNISAILKVVEKYMGKLHISERIFGGILEKGHLYAIGSSVGKDLQGVMNCKDIDEPTQVSDCPYRGLNVNGFYVLENI